MKPTHLHPAFPCTAAAALLPLLAALALTCIFTADAQAVYHPRLGRFLQRDPAEYVDGLNLYNYTRSNPVVLTDPTGGCAAEEPEVVEDAPCKCFCIESVKITDHKTWNPYEPDNPENKLWVGAEFTVTVKGEWKDYAGSFAPFGFEFWECFTNRPGDYPKRLAKKTWHNLYSEIPNHAIFDDINSGRTGEDLRNTYSLTDRPGATLLYHNEKQRAYWAIRATSSCPGGMCDKPGDEAFAKQTYDAHKGGHVYENTFSPVGRPTVGVPWGP